MVVIIFNLMNLRKIIKSIFRNKKKRLFFILFVVVYIVSPIDLVPDLVPVLGILDDGLLLSFTLVEIARNKINNNKK